VGKTSSLPLASGHFLPAGVPPPFWLGHSTNRGASADGRYIVFTSLAGNLDLNDASANGALQVYRRDTIRGLTKLVRRESLGRAVPTSSSSAPRISADAIGGSLSRVWPGFVRP